MMKKSYKRPGIVVNKMEMTGPFLAGGSNQVRRVDGEVDLVYGGASTNNTTARSSSTQFWDDDTEDDDL